MALTKKSSWTVVLVVLMLLMTQPAYSKRMPGRSVGLCKTKCYLRCLLGIFSANFPACVGICLVHKCGVPGKTFSHPSFHCGVGCVRSKCSNPGARNGNNPEECVSSCVNDCDANYAGDIF